MTLRGSRYENVRMVACTVNGRDVELPEVSEIPYLGEELVEYEVQHGAREGLQWDELAAELGLDEGDWWRVAFPNFEDCPDLLEIPALAELVLPVDADVALARGGDLTPAD